MSRDPKTAEARARRSYRRHCSRSHGAWATSSRAQGADFRQRRIQARAAARDCLRRQPQRRRVYPTRPPPRGLRPRVDAAIDRRTNGRRGQHQRRRPRARADEAVADLDHYFVLSFAPSGPADGKFHPVQVRVKRPGAQARSRSGYWAPDAAVAAAAAKAAAPKNTLPFRAVTLSPYIRPWIGMSRGPDGLTRVTVTWEPGDRPPRNQRVASILIKAHGERRQGAVRRPYRRGRRRSRDVRCTARLCRARDGDPEQQRRRPRHRLSRHLRAEPPGHQAHLRNTPGAAGRAMRATSPR